MELSSKWSLYLHYKDLGKLYNDNIEKLIDISDIETFWRTFNNIPKIYDIFSDGVNIKKIKRVNAIPCAYSFFRDDIFPCWEHSMNRNGFEYSIKNGTDLKKLHNEWMDCMLQLIGNNEPIMSHINGIRVVDCTKYSSVLYRMEIWVDNEKYKPDIEKIIKNEFNLSDYKLLYRSHKNIKETI
ncbi:MAG: hypothetical protein CMB31_01520 [Euryarchaeota archaeon]|nr:hypothetical protein [Euryarchaeota archaeon]|tara:strand:- start:753 stop:1301 length:549 start_codon:yes stop_codon:yes gene_type:complete